MQLDLVSDECGSKTVRRRGTAGAAEMSGTTLGLGTLHQLRASEPTCWVVAIVPGRRAAAGMCCGALHLEDSSTQPGHAALTSNRRRAVELGMARHGEAGLDGRWAHWDGGFGAAPRSSSSSRSRRPTRSCTSTRACSSLPHSFCSTASMAADRLRPATINSSDIAASSMRSRLAFTMRQYLANAELVLWLLPLARLVAWRPGD